MSSYTIPVNQKSTTNITLTTPGSGGSGVTYSNGVLNNPTTSTIQVKGDAVFEGNIKWQNRDLKEWLESIETRLGMLQPNPKLEAEWSELAEIRRQYVELEKQLIEKQQVFDILKKT